MICLTTSYGAKMDDAKERMKRGERQHYCFKTGLWEWTTDCGCSPRLYTMRELKRFRARLAKEIKP